MLKKLLSFRIIISLLILLFISQVSIGQGWVKSNKGLSSYQEDLSTSLGLYKIRFKNDGPLGKDWIVGSYLDEDSLYRVAAYRKGGKWVSFPVYFTSYSAASDMAMYGDTMYVYGYFWNAYDEIHNVLLPPSFLIKYFNDSIWVENPIQTTITSWPGFSVATKGDSIVVTGSDRFTSQDTIEWACMSPDKGKSWSYPFSKVHPTLNYPDFGNLAKIEILDNGDILTINNGSHPGSPYNGLSRWDGQQWHGYGTGISSLTQCNDFIFYNGELFMSGNFTTRFHPNDPGKLLARWDGTRWNDVGGGLGGDVAGGMFVENGVLYCGVLSHISDTLTRFGDAAIPYLAGWDGHRWCGTPSTTIFPYPPSSFSIINDTLFAAFFHQRGILNGDSSVCIVYFDGDYLHGPNSICSTLGIGEEEHAFEKTGISIYPNPSNDILNITLLKEAEGAWLSLFSLNGQLVFEQPLTEEQNQLKLPASLNGLYLAVIESDGKVFTEKLLVE